MKREPSRENEESQQYTFQSQEQNRRPHHAFGRYASSSSLSQRHGHIEYEEDNEDDSMLSDQESMGLTEDEDLEEDDFDDLHQDVDEDEEEVSFRKRVRGRRLYSQSTSHIMSIENLVGPTL